MRGVAAALRRLAAGDIVLVDDTVTLGRGQQAGLFVDVDPNHAFLRRLEFILGQPGFKLGRLLHELSPDGQGRGGALQHQLPIVVDTHPDDAEQTAGVSGKPAVMGGSGLACRRLPKPHQSSPDAGAPVDHPFHQVGHEVGHPRVDNLFGGNLRAEDDLAVTIDHVADYPRLHANTLIGEDGKGSRHLERGDLVGTQGGRRSGQDAVVHAGRYRQIDHLLPTDHFGEFYGGHVEGLGESPSQGHRPEEFFPVIVGFVGLLVEVEDCLDVFHHGRGRDQGFGVFDGRVDRSREDEGLEDGAGLPLGVSHPVQLAGPVVPAAHQGSNLSGNGIQGNQADLHPVIGRDLVPGVGGRIPSGPGAAPLAVGPILIGQVGAVPHDLVGNGLQVGVQGGVDLVALGEQFLIGIGLQEAVLEHVHEVGGVVLVDAVGSDLQRGLYGSLVLFRSDAAGFQHGHQHHVSAPHGSFRASGGAVAVGGLNQSRQQGGFRQVEVLDVLVEVGGGGLSETVDTEGTALSQVDVVGVEGENFLLGQACLQDGRHVDLFGLADDPSLPSQPEAGRSNQLLGDGAGPPFKSPQCHAHQGDGIEAVV